jgi:hypothetical protein
VIISRLYETSRKNLLFFFFYKDLIIKNDSSYFVAEDLIFLLFFRFNIKINAQRIVFINIISLTKAILYIFSREILIFFLFFRFRIKINAQRIASKLWSCRDVTRKHRWTIVQLNLFLNYSRQLMKKELIVNENCLNSELRFYNHLLINIYFFFFVRNQKIYMFYISHQISRFDENFFEMSSSILVIVFTSIVHLFVNSVYMSYTVLFKILVEVFEFEILDDFRLNYYN